ncbi:hypothetical protein BC793_114198 [Actinoplanes xinjiangensis]|uniref:Uncharacterized protein n=1 Tax=Actinoplanes xinjiangensis TaxID=512350 RepID=A0A316FSJ7_9ACTN|nr:hypothetical protein BC793_114198 [Actinoplanes xinjiangensis]
MGTSRTVTNGYAPAVAPATGTGRAVTNGYAPAVAPAAGTGRPRRAVGNGAFGSRTRKGFQRRFWASVRTDRRICSISANWVWVAVSGGASWITGSPRSSARQ